MSITRRDFMKRTSAGVLAASLPLTGCGEEGPKADGCDLERRGLGDVPDSFPALETYAHEGPVGPATLFSHGVASGDPLTDRVILWTRVSPEAEGEVEVFWEIGLDAEFTQRLNVGRATTSAEADYTVKVDATGLVAGRTHYYRFWLDGVSSPIGRTKTAPLDGVQHLRFGVVSCSSLAHGYFHVYERLAERPDLDAILHLGDYIYEYAADGYGSLRQYEPAHEIVSLEDYRTRYAQYRRDAQLQAVHRQHPFICVWDDHESANNSWSGGADNHQPDTEGDWADRKAAAQQAYAEWMPIRTDSPEVIYRRLRYGDLAELFMLDTRLVGRDEQVGVTEVGDEARSLLGFDQEAWLEEGLATTTAQWKLLGQQVMMAPLKLNGTAINFDQWDGYEPARERLLGFIEDEGVDDVVVLTGDIHTSWASDVPSKSSGYDRAKQTGSIVTEFVTPAVTSPGFLGAVDDSLIDSLRPSFPHIQYFELTHRGYIMLDVTARRVQADWYYVEGVAEDEGTEFYGASWSVSSGHPYVIEEAAPRETCGAAPLAP
jgi:alkaline phosphatase D